MRTPPRQLPCIGPPSSRAEAAAARPWASSLDSSSRGSAIIGVVVNATAAASSSPCVGPTSSRARASWRRPLPRRRPWGHRPRTRPPPCFVGAPAIRAPCGACHVRALHGRGRCLVVGGGGARRVCAFRGANVGLNRASGRHRCARAPRGGGRCLVGGGDGDGARQSPCRHEVLARADALSALRALSSTLSCPGGPKNAAELNGSSRWALLDVRGAGKNSAGLMPCPVSPLNFPPGFQTTPSTLGGPAKNRQRFRSVLLTP